MSKTTDVLSEFRKAALLAIVARDVQNDRLKIRCSLHMLLLVADSPASFANVSIKQVFDDVNDTINAAVQIGSPAMQDCYRIAGELQVK